MPDHVSDAVLLERFVRAREESAFVALVERHGPRVEGICRRLLQNQHDVEDVSQATFFVLARKAAVISWRESVGGWLCAVAHRLALGARSDNWRIQRHESGFTYKSPVGAEERLEAGSSRLAEIDHPSLDVLGEIERRDLSRVLYEEIAELPEKYRDPVLLCDLEGRTHKEAARQLGWPAGTMSRRLERARAILRRRLVQRGISLVIGLVGITLVALGLCGIGQKGAPSAVTVRQVMAPLRALSGEAPGRPGILSRIDGSQAIPDYAQVIALAQQANRIAAEIDKRDPAANQDAWHAYAREMHASSGLLAEAARKDERPAMILAARQLNASCVNCHDLFR
jgi:RNA polymerase sigma-70 factor (ECF subfamily)